MGRDRESSVNRGCRSVNGRYLIGVTALVLTLLDYPSAALRGGPPAPLGLKTVGLLAYLAMHALLLRNGIAAIRNSVRGTFEHAVATGALGCAVCFLLGSAGANVMSNVVSLWYLATFSAAGSYIARRNPVTGRVDGLYPSGRSIAAPAPAPASQAASSS